MWLNSAKILLFSQYFYTTVADVTGKQLLIQSYKNRQNLSPSYLHSRFLLHCYSRYINCQLKTSQSIFLSVLRCIKKWLNNFSYSSNSFNDLNVKEDNRRKVIRKQLTGQKLEDLEEILLMLPVKEYTWNHYTLKLSSKFSKLCIISTRLIQQFQNPESSIKPHKGYSRSNKDVFFTECKIKSHKNC